MFGKCHTAQTCCEFPYTLHTFRPHGVNTLVNYVHFSACAFASLQPAVGGPETARQHCPAIRRTYLVATPLLCLRCSHMRLRCVNPRAESRPRAPRCSHGRAWARAAAGRRVCAHSLSACRRHNLPVRAHCSCRKRPRAQECPQTRPRELRASPYRPQRPRPPHPLPPPRPRRRRRRPPPLPPQWSRVRQ